MLSEGDKAPDVTLQMADGSDVRLTSLLTRPLVLYFYPKDDTGGCTSEAKDFSEKLAAFELAGTSVLGISKDGPAKHAKFIAKYGLTVPLATDADGSVCEAFGTWIEKSLYGRKYMGIDRATFLIAGDGTVAKIWRKVKVKGHADAVLAAAEGVERVTETRPTLAARARDVLLTADPRAKVMAARAMARDWRLGRIGHAFDVAMPDRPARGDRPELLSPGRMPKRRKAGSLASRIALLHALAHIEYGAIDLAVDMAGRFGARFPRDFVDDWMKVASEEAMHFAILRRRLRALGSDYGALPAHDGLWEAAEETAHDPLARLAVVPLVLEARGLDVTPQTVARLEAAGDAISARILGRIYADEIGHVAIGVRWFERACRDIGVLGGALDDAGRVDPAGTWQALVRRHFRGMLKPPFNDSARDAAGLPREYYAQVAS